MKGQALVALLFFIIISITAISAAIILVVLNSQGASRLSQGQRAYTYAENGVNEAMVRMLRNPNFTNHSETYINGSYTVTVVPNGATGKIITSTGVSGNATRRIQATVSTVNDTYVITSRVEQ